VVGLGGWVFRGVVGSVLVGWVGGGGYELGGVGELQRPVLWCLWKRAAFVVGLGRCCEVQRVGGGVCVFVAVRWGD